MKATMAEKMKQQVEHDVIFIDGGGANDKY